MQPGSPCTLYLRLWYNYYHSPTLDIAALCLSSWPAANDIQKLTVFSSSHDQLQPTQLFCASNSDFTVSHSHRT
ncbi:hypothetical protein ABBQ38_015251 [Trebouxia sp. C0009 RCD-2024]